MFYRLGIMAAVAAAAWCSCGAAEAVTLKAIADAELRENGDANNTNVMDTGVGTDPSINARWIFPAPSNRNEWIALKFDLSTYPDKSQLQNIALRTYMYRANANNTKNLSVYALTPGTTGENWDEATITYGSMPGFTFDGNSATNVLNSSIVQSLGSFSVSGVTGEGNISLINPGALTTFVQGMGSNNLLTLLISTPQSTTGQWRVATREATQTETGVLTGAAGTFAPFLQFDVEVPQVPFVRGDYNNNGIVDAADYVVWRKNLNGTTLLNEEVSPGKVDLADYLYWRERFGAVDSGGAGQQSGFSVPEPSALALFLLAVGGLVLIRRPV